jgi:hypothetical protein
LPHDVRVVLELAESPVTPKAEQPAHFTGRVIVIYMQGAYVKTDQAEATLAVGHLCHVILSEAVSTFEEVASRASVIFRLVLGHRPVVTRAAVIREPRLIGPISPEFGERPDLLTSRAVLESLRHGRPLSHLLTAFSHPLAVTRP